MGDRRMRVSVELILDSTSPAGTRLTTFRVYIPKWLLGQLARHRKLSMSAGSSRALPVAKALAGEVYVPERWPVAGPGMVPKEFRDNEETRFVDALGYESTANDVWQDAYKDAVN